MGNGTEERHESGRRLHQCLFSNLVNLLSNKLTDVSILHLSRDGRNYCFFGEFLLGEEEFILWFPKSIVKGSSHGSWVGPQDFTPEWHVRGGGQGLGAEAAWMRPSEAGVGSGHGGRSRANCQGSDEAKKIWEVPDTILLSPTGRLGESSWWDYKWGSRFWDLQTLASLGLVAKSCPTLVMPWTIAHQAPLSMVFPRQEYWSGLPFPSPEDLPTQGPNSGLLHCRQILYQLSHQGSS